MKLTIGLGNPGPKYQTTRHNVGFMALEHAYKEHFKALDFPAFKSNKKLMTDISSGKMGKEKIILAKPQTYMNNSGQAVQAVAQFYKIKSQDIIVIHDDLDLPFGKIRINKQASAAGHNGVKSIIEYLDTKNFMRLRIGVGHPTHMGYDVIKYVLQPFGKNEKKQLPDILEVATKALVCLLEEGVEEAMNGFN